MKGRRCFSFLLLLLLPLLASIFTAKTVSAVSVSSRGVAYPTTQDTRVLVPDENYVGSGIVSRNNLIFTQIPFSGVTKMGWTVDRIIPANSLVSLTIEYSVKVPSGASNLTPPPGAKYYGLELMDGRTVLSDSCFTAKEQLTIGLENYFTCRYLYYNPYDTNVIDSMNDTRILGPYNGTYSSAQPFFEIVITPASYITLNPNGLTSDDRTWLEEALADNATDVSSVVSKLNEVKAEQQATTRAVEAQTRQQHEDYENEVDREEAKEDELDDQKDDLNISAQNPGNPFASLFNVSGCASLPVFSQWFHQDSVTQVCSPYPEQVRPVIEFVSSVIVIGLLIRIYFKNFKGGYSS